MTEDVIGKYDTFYTKGCLEDLILIDFIYQHIPSTYSDLTNDYDNNGTQIDAALLNNKGVKYAVVKSDENKNDDSLSSYIYHPKTIL